MASWYSAISIAQAFMGVAIGWRYLSAFSVGFRDHSLAQFSAKAKGAVSILIKIRAFDC